jgi:hypothetical protein
MRKGHSAKIKFEGGEFTRAELKKKPISILVNLLVTEKNAATNFHDEWEMGQEVNRVAQKEAREAEEQRDELQNVLDNLETVIQFRLDTVFDIEHRPTYDTMGNQRPQAETETPEEQKVLLRLHRMITAISRDKEDHVVRTLGRGY